MAYDVTAFSDYIARETKALTKTLFIGGDTGKFSTLQAGIKGSMKIPLITGTTVLQEGNCPTPSGDDVIGEVTISVEAFTVYKSYCQEDLETKLPNQVIGAGSNHSDTLKPFEENIVDIMFAGINKTLELTYWQGTDGSGSYPLFDGYIAQIDAELTANTVTAAAGFTVGRVYQISVVGTTDFQAIGASADTVGIVFTATGAGSGTGSALDVAAAPVDGNPTGIAAGTGIILANVVGITEGMFKAASVDVKRSDDFVILVGDDVFDLYIEQLKILNLFHYNAEHNDGVYKVGGSGATIQRVRGLDGTSRLFAGRGASFIVGADQDGEENAADVWYDKTDDKMYIRVKAKAGAQVSNPEEMVEFTLV